MSKTRREREILRQKVDEERALYTAQRRRKFRRLRNTGQYDQYRAQKILPKKEITRPIQIQDPVPFSRKTVRFPLALQIKLLIIKWLKNIFVISAKKK